MELTIAIVTGISLAAILISVIALIAALYAVRKATQEFRLIPAPQEVPLQKPFTMEDFEKTTGIKSPGLTREEVERDFANIGADVDDLV